MKHYVVCDLDDCLIRTDLLYQQWILLLKYRPALFFLSFFWLLRGKFYFKNQIATSLHVSADSLPYRKQVIEYLKKMKSSGDYLLVLASASPYAWVSEVAHHIGLFDLVIGSKDGQNLRGTSKLEAIQQHIGDQKFTYLGDHTIDLKIWKHADQVVAINPSTSLQEKIKKLNNPYEFIFDQKQKSFWRLIVRQIRVHQWVKNSLIFLPALASHQVLQWPVLLNCIIAFFGFSFTASFVYVLNDLLDLQNDRVHASKKNRPFASGDLHIKNGITLLFLLISGTFLFSSFLPLNYGLVLVSYLILNFVYSIYLKQSLIVDVIILAMMYTLRIYAGSMATNIPVSEWLLSFSTLFFFGLACVKRFTEISRTKNTETIQGRGYGAVDRPIIMALGIGTSLLSILVILLYLQSKDVRMYYAHPEYMWFILPILLFWVSRIWVLANRDQVHDDPVVFAAKDKTSWLSVLILVVIAGLSV